MKPCRGLLFAAALLRAQLGWGQKGPALPWLTSVRQVRELSRAEAARGCPVCLWGMVTFHDWFLTFVQDATGGIYLRNFNPELRAGREVEVESFSALGRSLPIVVGRDGGQGANSVAGRP